MYAIEFQTKISNGNIELPQELVGKLTGEVRVIVLKQEQSLASENPTENLIDRLLNKPISQTDFSPIAREEIYKQA